MATISPEAIKLPEDVLALDCFLELDELPPPDELPPSLLPPSIELEIELAVFPDAPDEDPPSTDD